MNQFLLDCALSLLTTENRTPYIFDPSRRNRVNEATRIPLIVVVIVVVDAPLVHPALFLDELAYWP